MKAETPVVTKKDVLLYVGVPFCSSKCHFCFWVSRIPKNILLAKPGQGFRDSYVEAVITQIKNDASEFSSNLLVPRLIYFGGGTPGLLSNKEIEALWLSLGQHFDLSSVRESTFESTPETLTNNKVSFLRQLGFTRISIGAQTFNNKSLKYIGRTHTIDDIDKAVKSCKQAGFKDINIDLIIGLPCETEKDVIHSVKETLQRDVNHITLYLFQPSPETKFYGDIQKKNIPKPNYKQQLLQYTNAKKMCVDAGFDEYSLLYFGKDSAKCHTSMAYFNMQMDWLGFGAGAHSLFNGQVFAPDNHTPSYVANPLRKAQVTKVSQALYPLFSCSITTKNGINKANWLERGLENFDIFFQDPHMHKLILFLQNKNLLDIDEKGIRFKSDKMAEAYLQYQEYQLMHIIDRPTPEYMRLRPSQITPL